MRILVIDDDPDVLVLCRISLAWEGHEVAAAASGEEGLELIDSFHPDVVVLDVMMPHLDGLEVLRRIRSHPETDELPVVLLTARVGILDQIEGWTSGADGFVMKPFFPSALAAALDVAFGPALADREAAREAHLQQLVAR